MASYTIELRKICDLYSHEEVENWFKNYNLNNYLTASQIQVINNANLWSKEKLAKKIVEHYFTREIGFETPALFKQKVEIKMEEIMEEKLPLIYSNAIEYDPLVNVDFTETFEKTAKEVGENKGIMEGQTSSEGTLNGQTTSKGNSSSNSNNSASGLNVNSDTPQGQINKQSILNGDYASNTSASETSSQIQDTTENETSGTTSQTDTTSGKNSQTNKINTDKQNTENYTKRIKGNSGVSATAQAMIKQFRQNIIAIDKEIIESLNSLFMGLY